MATGGNVAKRGDATLPKIAARAATMRKNGKGRQCLAPATARQMHSAMSIAVRQHDRVTQPP